MQAADGITPGTAVQADKGRGCLCPVPGPKFARIGPGVARLEILIIFSVVRFQHCPQIEQPETRPEKAAGSRRFRLVLMRRCSPGIFQEAGVPGVLV